MTLEVKITCPLGSECEVVKDGAIHRCAWYVKLQGHNPQNDTPIDEWKCAMAWQPILQVENAGASRSVNAAVDSLRNETVSRQNIALGALSNVKIIESK